ncbi:sodium/solute symporter domain-containing protein [Desulfonema limicola]|uniref:Sodium/solute symporter domain-containing protein n=1 Tax=Desulfonema limicola TaxID=45656 RepID=A0A975B9S2_9BACT|nr:hypothetical protein [Desulfonema limicola]QTA81398.1 sodium/solute symporter domain-containing protein [Desulfonema limicola]
MNRLVPEKKNILIYIIILSIMLVLAIWMKNISIKAQWQEAGLVNFSLGFVLLGAYAAAQMLKNFKLPLISGYIFSGIIAGPYVTSFLDFNMVEQLSLVNDLALSFIAMTAGGELKLQSLKERAGAISLNIVLHSAVVFGVVFFFIFFTSQYFNITRNLTPSQIIVFAMLLGVIAIARSPSSAIAIIREYRASGPFTETVLGVTVAIDVLIIVLFTIALSIARFILSSGSDIDYQTFAALFSEIGVSFIIGALTGKFIAYYIRASANHLGLFLLFLAFGITRSCMAFNGFMEYQFNVHLNLEPLLICMCAGFTVQNFSKQGLEFNQSLEKTSLPVFLLFFTIAGAALNLKSLAVCWPMAVCLFFVRAAGIFIAVFMAGVVIKEPLTHKKYGWMAYLTQAGVAIGLAQLAQRHSSEIGIYLTTVVLAVITINQVIGPVTFKTALNLAGEIRKNDREPAA